MVLPVSAGRLRSVLCTLGAFTAGLVPLAAPAALVPYSFTLTVQSASDLYPPSCVGAPLQYFSCSTQPGDTFKGSFWVDDSALKKSGSNISVPVTGFMLRIGSIVWDQNHPSDFGGLRDGLSYPSSGNALAFDISNGIITGILGGVWGQSDPPYLDFLKGNTFAALDPGGMSLTGTTAVAPAAVTEPATAALVLLAALGVLVGRGRGESRFGFKPAALKIRRSYTGTWV